MPTLTQMAESERLAANRANEERYQQMLAQMRTARKRMTTLFDTARAQLATQGRQAGIDIDVGAARTGAQQTQGLMSAGLGNTTIRSAVARGVETDRTAAQARLSEGLSAQRAGLLTQQAQAEMGGAQAMVGMMGSRQDVGPDLGRYASMIQQANAGPSAWQASGGGGGGSGIGLIDRWRNQGSDTPTDTSWQDAEYARLRAKSTETAAAGVQHSGRVGVTGYASATQERATKTDPYASQVGKTISRYAGGFGALSKAGRIKKSRNARGMSTYRVTA